MNIALSLSLSGARAVSLLPGLSLSASTVPENGTQGTTVFTATPTNASNPGAVSIFAIGIAGALQMNVDGATVEQGATVLNFETDSPFNVTFRYTDDNGTYDFVRTISIGNLADGPTTTGATTTLEAMLGTPEVGVASGGDLRDLFVSPTSQTLTFAVSHGTIAGDGYTWSWTPGTAQTETVTVTATDEDSQELAIDIQVDVAAANQAPTAGNVTLEFAVAEFGNPAISSSSPADNATDVAITVDPTVTFDRNIVFGASGTITLYDVTGTAVLETFDVATEQGTSPGQVSISGAVLTIHPTSDLSNSNEYAIQWTAGAVESAEGAPVAALSDTTTISFTTEAAAASIQFVGRQAHLINSTSTSLDITTLTGGIASAPAENDVVIVHYGIGTLANRNPAVTGYTSIASIHVDGASRDVNLAVAWKAMGSTPDTTVAVTATNSSASKAIVLVEVWRGVNTTTPMDVAATTDGGDGTVLPNPASITPVTSGAKVVACGVGSHTAGAFDFSSSDLSNVYADNNNGTNDVSMLCGSVDWTSGAVDPAAFTFGTSDNSGYCRTAVTYALRPA